MFTKTTLFHKPNEGGGSGGDQHNLGWYATPEALRTAHATATAGDWAIVGSTDTVWIWDTDTSAWKDSDQKGQVASVNGQTGTVVLTASDVGAATSAQGALADTAIQSVKTINGQSIVGTGDVTVGGLPDQTGQNGKFLTTDGTDASWSNKPLVNTYTGAYSAIGILGTVGGLGTGNVVIGSGATANGNYAPVAIGASASCGSGGHASIAIGNSAKAFGNNSVSIGHAAEASAECAIQIGGSTSGQSHVNNKANTFMVANNNGNFEIMSADGTVPADRLKNAINKYSTMPTAASTNEGWIVQFTGTTDSTYTHGHLYECVSDGQDPATYSWTEVQLGGGGGSSYTAGTGIDITNDVISVTAPTLQNTATTAGYLSIFGNNSGLGVGICGSVGTSNLGGIAIGGSTVYQATATGGYGAIAIGRAANAGGTGGVAIGREAGAGSEMSLALGYYAKVEGASYAIQLGYGTNTTANTFSVGLGQNNNYQLLASNGTIPEARLADMTNATAGQVLTLDSNLNAVWATGGSGGGISDVTVNGTSVVSGGVATITGMVQNIATGSYSLSLFGAAASSTDAINIGLYSEACGRGIALGHNAISATNMWHGGIAIGDETYARTVQIAIGSGAQCYNQGFYGIAIGQNARTSADSAMQISLSNNTVTNSDANTVKIANANGNFEMMSADGTIPAARHAALPSADGTYVLKLVIADGVPTLSWVAE